MTHPPWSYSSLTAFETCAKRYYHIKVAKDVPDPPGEAAKWGSTVHKHIEDRLRDGKELPEAISEYERIVKPLQDSPGTKIVEYQMAVDAALQPVQWDSASAWCRGIVDVGVLHGPKALLLDWKTGKRKVDSDQLKLFAALAFSHYPELEIVHTGFIWLKEGRIDKQPFTRDEAPAIWTEFVPRVIRFKRAYEEEKFPPKPSGLCKNWCPVPKRLCEFSGKK